MDSKIQSILANLFSYRYSLDKDIAVALFDALVGGDGLGEEVFQLVEDPAFFSYLICPDLTLKSKRHVLNRFIRCNAVASFKFMCAQWNYKPALRTFFSNDLMMSNRKYELAKYFLTIDASLATHFVIKTLKLTYISNVMGNALVQCSKFGARLPDIDVIDNPRITLYKRYMEYINCKPADHLPFIIAFLSNPIYAVDIAPSDSLVELGYIGFMGSSSDSEMKSMDSAIRTRLALPNDVGPWKLMTILDMGKRDESRFVVASVVRHVSRSWRLTAREWCDIFVRCVTSDNKVAINALETNFAHIICNGNLLDHPRMMTDLFNTLYANKCARSVWLVAGLLVLSGYPVDVYKCATVNGTLENDMRECYLVLSELSERCKYTDCPFDNTLYGVISGFFQIFRYSQRLWTS